MRYPIINFFTRVFDSLHERSFRLYFFGQGLSSIGYFIQAVAATWLVLELSGSGTVFGAVVACEYLPMLLVSPWISVLADRYPKRRILLLTQIAFFLSTTTFGILIWTNHITLPLVFVLVTIQGLINSLDNPTRLAFIGEVVSSERLHNALTLGRLVFNLSRIIGVMLGALIVVHLGIQWCFWFNALSYLLFFVVLLCVRITDIAPHRLAPVARGLFREGIVYAWRTPVIRMVLLMMVPIGILTYEFQVSIPLLVTHTFHGTAEDYAMFLSAIGIGAIIGGIISAASNWGKATVVPIAIGLGLTMFLVAFAPSRIGCMVMMVVLGATSIALTSTYTSVIQTECLPTMRSRMMGLWNAVFLGSTPLGGILVGWIADTAGARWGVAIGGIAAFVASGYGWYAIRHMSYIRPDPVLSHD